MECRNLVEVPKYKGLGAQLLAAAVQQSLMEGFRGRIGLHALRDGEPFYAGRGMTRVGPDAHYHNLVYFEFTAAQAMLFVNHTGS